MTTTKERIPAELHLAGITSETPTTGETNMTIKAETVTQHHTVLSVPCGFVGDLAADLAAGPRPVLKMTDRIGDHEYYFADDGHRTNGRNKGDVWESPRDGQHLDFGFEYLGNYELVGTSERDGRRHALIAEVAPQEAS